MPAADKDSTSQRAGPQEKRAERRHSGPGSHRCVSCSDRLRNVTPENGLILCSLHSYDAATMTAPILWMRKCGRQRELRAPVCPLEWRLLWSGRLREGTFAAPTWALLWGFHGLGERGNTCVRRRPSELQKQRCLQITQRALPSTPQVFPLYTERRPLQWG